MKRIGFRVWLPLAFATVVAGFVASTAYTQHRASAIDDAAVAIASNTSPSIEHLSTARAELRHLQLLLSELLEAGTRERPVDETAILETRDRVRQEAVAYLALPVPLEERPLWKAVGAGLTELDEATRGILLQSRLGAHEAARSLYEHEFRAAMDHTSAAIAEIIEFNAQHAQDLAMRIQALRNRSAHVAYGLDVVSIGLAILAAVLLARAIRAHTAMMEAHSRLLETRAAELEQFAGRLAHDILSPLGAVGFALELSGRPLEESKKTDLVRRGQRSLYRVRTIVEGLLDFARAGARPPPGARADLQEVVEDLATELVPAATEAGIELFIEPFPPCAAACSPGVLTSLISNLVRNAIKYIGEGPERKIVIRVMARRPLLRIEIVDTGPGLPPGLEDKVFDLYFRAPGNAKSGIGLGLATVKRMSEAHGGRVGVRSEVGRGCVFWFELPWAPPRDAKEPSSPETPVPQGGPPAPGPPGTAS